MVGWILEYSLLASGQILVQMNDRIEIEQVQVVAINLNRENVHYLMRTVTLWLIYDCYPGDLWFYVPLRTYKHVNYNYAEIDEYDYSIIINWICAIYYHNPE